MFWKRVPNTAIAFVDYEYWYVSMKELYHAVPDLKGWSEQLRERYQVESLRFFGNFLKVKLTVSLEDELSGRLVVLLEEFSDCKEYLDF